MGKNKKKTTYCPPTDKKKPTGKNSDKGNNEPVNDISQIKGSKYV